MSSHIWTKYIFETYPWESGHDKIECGVRCELAATHCDFYVVSSGKCHLGRYAYYGLSTVVDYNTAETYHKSGIIKSIIFDSNVYCIFME